MNKACIAAVVLSVSLSVIGHAQTLSVTNGLTLQFEANAGVFASDGTTPAANGAAVGRWANQTSLFSGAGDAVQTTGTDQPTYLTGVVNGLPVIRFDGSNDWLVNSTNAYVTKTSGFTIFAIFRAASVTGAGAYGYLDPGIVMDTAGDFGMPLQNVGGTAQVGTYNFNLPSYGTVWQNFATNQFTFAVSKLSVGQYTSIQSASAGSGNPGTTNSASGPSLYDVYPLGIGGDYNGGVSLNGDIAEILVYNRPLTTNEQYEVTSYLNDKYALGILPIPEPASLTLFGAGMLALIWRRRRSSR